MDAVTDAGVRPRKLGLALIPEDKVPAIAERVFHLVERGCNFSGGRFDPAAVLQACAGANPAWHPQLWIAGYSGGTEKPSLDSIAVTQISVFETGLRILEIVLVGGERARSWMQFESDFAAWAARQGCSRMQVIGRRGWGGVLSDEWRESARVFERPINAGKLDGPK